MPRVALVTCEELPDLHEDDQLLVAPLAERGVDAVAAVWDDPSVDWDAFDLAVIRSTWDYPRRRDEFLAWARRVPRLANPAKVLEWNTDKTYLRALSAAGVPVVPTTWFEPGDGVRLPAAGECVIKPAVGAGSIDTGRYRLDHPAEHQLADEHVARLLERGAAMLQPYVDSVDTTGETSLLYFAGRFSHAIGKAAMLDGPDKDDTELFRPERIEPRDPDESQLEVGRATLAAIPSNDDLLYARVDLVAADDGSPILLEVELTEPSLFLADAPGSAARMADTVVARL